MTDVPPVGPAVDMEWIGKLLRRIEARQEMAGWHSNAHMYVYAIYDHHDAVTGDALRRLIGGTYGSISNPRYTAQTIVGPHVLDLAYNAAGLQPDHALRRFALNVAYADEAAIADSPDDAWIGEGLTAFRKIVRMPGILGFALSCEAYATDSTAAAVRALRTGRHLRTVRGAKEIRSVYMVDVLDRVHEVLRPRGRPAELLLDTSSFGGPSNSLRMLVDTAMNRVPDAEDFEARYPRGIDQARDLGLITD